MGWRELYERGSMHGVVTYEDAERCGVPAATLDGRARREGWPDRPHRGVLVLPGRVLDDHGRIYAAYRSVPGVSAVGGEAALYLHGLSSRAPSRTDLWVPLSHRGTSTETRRVRRSKLLRGEDLTYVRDIPTVRAAWAIRDVSADRDVDSLRNLLIDGRFRRLLVLEELNGILTRDRRMAGRARLAELLAELEDDGSDSGFEFRTRGRLTDLGLAPDPHQRRLETPGGVRRLDLAYSRFGVGVECHGFRFHGDREQFDADASRWNDVATVGEWITLHLTWSMQYGAAWDRFVDRLTSVLVARGYPRP